MVVCPEGQRHVATIALRAPCSGIEIQDDKQTNKHTILHCRGNTIDCDNRPQCSTITVAPSYQVLFAKPGFSTHK